MSSLPILSSQTPSNGKVDAGKTDKNALNAEDIANGAAPFGELLAKQLSPQGRDIKGDLLKTLTLADSDTDSADLNGLTEQLRPDGIAIPADLLASLQQKDLRMTKAGITTEKATTSIAALRGEAEAHDPATKRIAPDVAGEIKPDTQLANDKPGKQVDVREVRAAKAGTAPDATFAAALQAEKKTAISAATAKIDIAIQPAQPSNTPSIGITNAQSAAPVAQAAATQATVSTPLNQPQWADDFSQKVTWMATQRSQSAQLHLNPAQLGPLEVSLKLNGDQATVQFTSAHAAVREAIEQSIPRLRDMLADSGISLGNTTVSDQAPREQQQREQAGSTSGDNSADNSLESDSVQMQTTTRLSRHDGVVDTFV
ncbi:MAG: flagellar hook-length control protein FliK [Gammaproteobacteria bacterium]|nr:flagellar hook-length control protein FliK [Gammaproteobacteria bacterium]MBU1623792.1 flagellar hook-length control protein FliK [Gammaproteobacteria bacterium]MBU1982009.1 flagellar hook-length control protein FliK [Gammaproteobacteria bacterium]